MTPKALLLFFPRAARARLWNRFALERNRPPRRRRCLTSRHRGRDDGELFLFEGGTSSASRRTGDEVNGGPLRTSRASLSGRITRVVRDTRPSGRG